MASAQITHENAAARHGEQVQAICKKLGAQPSEIAWSYDWGMRVDGRQRIDAAKGIGVFLQNPECYGISLVGQTGRKHRHERLDSQALAQDPTQWPVEMFDTPKPQGPSIWVWQPRRTASPGWNEAVVVSCKQSAKGNLVAIQAVTDDGNTQHFHRMENNGWEEGTPDQDMRRCKSIDATQIIQGLPGARMVARQESVADLLAKLGADPGVAAAFNETTGGEIDDGQDMAPTDGSGRQWPWGQSIHPDEIRLYTDLLASKEGVSSGNFADVIDALSNPGNRLKNIVADGILDGIARGKDAMQAARETIEANKSLPNLPEGCTDIAAFIDESAKQLAPARLRPVILGRH